MTSQEGHAGPTPIDSSWPSLTSDAGLTSMRELLVAAEMATVMIGINGQLIDANHAGTVLFGPLSTASDHSDGHQRLRNVIDQIPQQLLSDPRGGVWRGDIDLSTPGGDVSIHATTVLVRHDTDSPTGGVIGVVCRDVTDERQASAELLRLLEHDPTTGLLNRNAAIARTTDALSSVTDGGEVAILTVDIDGLRDVNDALGHEVGNRLLTSTARRLATAIRPQDLVARTGGDEFVVLCQSVPDVAAAMELADRIRRALTGRLTIKQLELDVSVSVGVSVSDAVIRALPATQAASQLLARADTAVHAAKQTGRGKAALYTPQLGEAAKLRTELAAALSKALRDDQLYLDFQPIFSAVTEQIEAAEALLRWTHPERGRVEAKDFIPVAEETGVIVPIGDWVLQQACATTRGWIDDGVVDHRFAVHVNVSRLQLCNGSFANRVVDVLREYRLRPRQLVLEVREATLLGSDTDEVIRSVRALRRVGVRIALDNFGTGSRALSLLTDIGADVLKLDGTLALPSGASETDIRVVRALVLLAHALNMEVVAERVIGEEQLRRLRAAGCDLMQGHLLGKPAPADQIGLRPTL